MPEVYEEERYVQNEDRAPWDQCQILRGVSFRTSIYPPNAFSQSPPLPPFLKFRGLEQPSS